VTNASGSISASGVQGAFEADTRFGSVRGERIGGAATVDNTSGSVSLTGVGADARVRTTFASAFLAEVAGAIDVQNQSGAISVTKLRGRGCQPVSLRTTFSTIRLALPANSAYAVNARTSFGSIRSELPISTTSISDANVIGTIGGGTCKLDLANKSGNIVIEKE
jgi:DUF4097 and DUF4098 domain-containing protein YvlB